MFLQHSMTFTLLVITTHNCKYFISLFIKVFLKKKKILGPSYNLLKRYHPYPYIQPLFYNNYYSWTLRLYLWDEPPTYLFHIKYYSHNTLSANTHGCPSITKATQGLLIQIKILEPMIDSIHSIHCLIQNNSNM